MMCIRKECQGATAVIDSRAVSNYVRRRRVCLTCGTRFSTREHYYTEDPPKSLSETQRSQIVKLHRELTAFLEETA